MTTKTLAKTTVQLLGVNRETLERETHVLSGFDDETTMLNDYTNENKNFVLCSHKTVTSRHKIKMSDRDFVLFGQLEKTKGSFYRNIDVTRIHGVFCDVKQRTVYDDTITLFSDETEKDIPDLLPVGVYLVEKTGTEKHTICVFMSPETFYNNGTEV